MAPAAAPQAPRLTPEPCRITDADGLVSTEARCGKLEVPEDPADPQGRKISLAIAVVPAVATKAKPDPLVLIAGGPGQGSIEAYAPLLDSFAGLRRERDLDALLDEFNITRLHKSPSIALSGGERRRVEIARALASRPSYMLLDEPFAGIDPIAVGDIQQLVKHLTYRGIGVLITDHNVRETLGLTDRAYIIYSGEVLMEGRAEDIVNNPDVRRLYLGEEFRL